MTDSITALVRKMRPKRYTVNDAAKLVEKSPDTLSRWRRKGTFVPSHTHQFGGVTVYLYDSNDIKAMKKVAKAQKPGRKKADASSTEV